MLQFHISIHRMAKHNGNRCKQMDRRVLTQQLEPGNGLDHVGRLVGQRHLSKADFQCCGALGCNLKQELKTNENAGLYEYDALGASRMNLDIETLMLLHVHERAMAGCAPSFSTASS
jgi:hypothetical protein